ncbi:MAG: methylmalonyl Co-A mutase-associated GTPase MeaB [Bacteroidetes bacterium]|nr:methylmalonyl Co-A mutase-associated GTPase MeaB [Bacteroidota bacterium]
MSRLLTIQEYVNGLRAGDIAILSKAITLIESSKLEHKQLAQELIDAILPFTGKSVRIGITGVPGVGKSTFIESFGMHLIEEGKKVAVLAIDPSSSISKGSILGDKTRMEKLSIHPNAFIRPSASSGSLGGVTYKTREATLLCEAAGFDTIIIETVGVGQSETEVSTISDFFLLLMLAGAGDELQGIKRGIMEMADGIAITKADGANATKAKGARAEYANALHFLPPNESGWIPEVKTCSSYEGIGINEIHEMIKKFVHHQTTKGFFDLKRKEQNLFAFRRLLDEQLKNNFIAQKAAMDKVKQLEQDVLIGTISPYSAVYRLLQ